jgi:hypothetical protein
VKVGGRVVREYILQLLWSDWVSTYAVTSRNNRSDVASGVLCGSATDRPSSVQGVDAVQLRVQLWSPNQRETEAEDSLPGNV